MSNTQIQTQQAKPSVLAIMAARYNIEPAKLFNTLKETCFKGATEEQMTALCIVANIYGLNPFLKEVYAFPAKGGGIVPVVSVDGWISLMNKNESFDGIEFEAHDSEDGKPHAVTSIIHIKGRSRPVKVTEYWQECKRNTDPWNTCPRRMLRHKALIQGARIAFGFSGIYDEDEGADQLKTVTGYEVQPIFKQPKQIAAAATVVSAPTPAPTAEEDTVDLTPAPETAAAPAERTETALETLIRYCSEYEIPQDVVMTHLAAKNVVRPDQKRFSELTSRKQEAVLADWDKIVHEIREGGE